MTINKSTSTRFEQYDMLPRGIAYFWPPPLLGTIDPIKQLTGSIEFFLLFNPSNFMRHSSPY